MIPLIVILALLFVFPLGWVSLVVIVAYTIVMSYQRSWEINVSKNQIIGKMGLLFFGFNDITIDLNSVVELRVYYYQGSSRYYSAVLKDSDGVKTVYASRIQAGDLVPIVRDLRNYLPDGTSYSIDKHCKNPTPFHFLEQV